MPLPGLVMGIVHNLAGQPIAGATLSCVGCSYPPQTTDTTGQYIIWDTAGTYLYSVTHDWYRDRYVEIEIPELQSVTQNIKMYPPQ